jgi:ABC-type antimicrobial peptide transport system permease subunit
VRTMDERLSSAVAEPRFQALLLGTFAALALLLAAVGIYGIVAQSVAERTREIGIRMALGANCARVLRQVMAEGMALALTGVALGLAGALAAGRMLSALLYGVTASDPLTYAGASLVLTGIAAAACYLPARRAARVDPVIALRWE